ncbi:hypothetical protein FQA47_005553 [Oryzias melastigma]|uniref:Uncharacterized protein n=1 Tax=Oryzias melastigma TaxID=30732 RepID=A0A834FAW5_ORYME|nr:hypothetical protein FQA47_005553 [Oryzias melastigma]
MDGRSCFLTTKEGQNVQVMKDSTSLKLYLDDRQDPTRWFIQKKDKQRLTLCAKNEGRFYVLMADSSELSLKSVPSINPVDLPPDEDCQCEITNCDKGNFYALKFIKPGKFLSTKNSKLGQEIVLTENEPEYLHITDVEL